MIDIWELCARMQIMKDKKFDVVEKGILMAITYSWDGGLLYGRRL